MQGAYQQVSIVVAARHQMASAEVDPLNLAEPGAEVLLDVA